MGAAEYVDRAVWMSKEITRAKTRGPGDIENAMRGIEREYGIDFWTLWRLRYRARDIKDIGCSVFARLEAAYQRECQRQRDRYDHELAVTAAICRLDSAPLGAVEALADQATEAPRDAADFSET